MVNSAENRILHEHTRGPRGHAYSKLIERARQGDITNDGCSIASVRFYTLVSHRLGRQTLQIAPHERTFFD